MPTTIKNDRATWFQAGNSTCSIPPGHPRQTLRLVLLGPPGIGKGTQAQLLCNHFGLCHLSTGDIFRSVETLKDRASPALQTAVHQMHSGELVSDSTVIEIIKERMQCLRCEGGFALDGFPRTIIQAEALQALLDQNRLVLHAVVNYELPLDEIVARLSGRRVCAHCRAVFHLTQFPPKKAGICDHCGKELIQREDDRPESVRVRMRAYDSSTKPLIDYYQECNLLVSVRADGAPEAICKRTVTALEQLRNL